MDFLDNVLPFYVDYLGRFEYDKEENILNATDALSELLRSGTQQKVLVRNAEINFSDDRLVLTNADRVVVQRFSLKRVKDPVAFKKRNDNKNSSGSFKQVVIFTETGGGHFNNDVFHAFLCTDTDPDELVESITAHINPPKDDEEIPVLRNKGHTRSPSQASGEGTLRGSHNGGVLASFSGTDSVRSATIRRGGNGGRPRSSIQVFDQGPMPGVPPPEVIPIAMPTPPTPRANGTMANGSASRRKDTPNGTNENGRYKPPLVAKLSNKLSSGPGSLEPNHRFQYNATDDYSKKDSILLNCCIEDIERFREMLKTVPKSTPNDKIHGDVSAYENALSAKDQFKATDFVCVFQKFKLAFNLLARLDGYIKDPPSRELIYFLFPPLARILDESHDLFGVDLVRDIVSPLPTRRALQMMDSCLGEREKTLWQALGDYWLHPRTKWEGDIPPYKPIFHDGWSPGVIDFPEDDEDNLSTIANYALIRQRQRPKSFSPPATSPKGNISIGEKTRRMERQTSVVSSATITSWGSGNTDNVSAIISKDYQTEFRDDLMDTGLNVVLVTHTRDRKHGQEISIVKGEYLELLDSSRNWWRCRNITNEIGYAPCTLLRKIMYEQGTPSINGDDSQLKHTKAVAPDSSKHIANGSRNNGAISNEYRHSKRIDDRRSSRRGGRRESSSTESSSTLSEGDQPPMRHNQYSREFTSNNEAKRKQSPPKVSRGPSPPPVMVSAPPAAPPPPPPMIVQKESPMNQLMTHKGKYGELSKNSSLRSRTDSVYSAMSVQDELRSVLEVFRDKDKQLDIVKTPDIYVSQESRPAEVRSWLKAKNFSQRALDQFKNIDGKKLLSLKRNELTSAFGKVEGARLDGQLEICRKTTGYGTASSELRNILAKAKKRTEEERRESLRQGQPDDDFQTAA